MSQNICLLYKEDQMKEGKYFSFSHGYFSEYYIQLLSGFSTKIQKENGNWNPSKTFQEFENKVKNLL